MRESIKKTLCRVGIVLMLAFALPCLAQAQTAQCLSKDAARTFVYYVNGIHASRSGAADNAKLIRDAYKNRLEEKYRNVQDPSRNELFEFSIIYNPSEWDDIIEVFVQTFNEMGMSSVTDTTPYSIFWALVGYIPIAVEIEIARDLSISIVTLKELKSIITDATIGRYSSSIVSRVHKVTLDIRDKVSGNLREGSRVLLIPHSQGNWRVNDAVYPLLSSYRNNIGVLGIASPDSSLADESTSSPSGLLRYITADDDRVINRLRRSDSSVLPGNLDNDPGLRGDTRGITNHKFQKAYFAPGLASRAQIDDIIDVYFPGSGATNGILQPTDSTPLGRGPITVRLTWGSEPDVDLHVYEPDDTHVYYGQRRGAAGFLDLDDRNGEGPEHYFVSCETIKVGTYRVGVNYFKGDGPETARVMISTGDGRARTYTQVLREERSTSGNNSPFHVATITVDRNANGEYSYIVSRPSDFLLTQD